MSHPHRPATDPYAPDAYAPDAYTSDAYAPDAYAQGGHSTDVRAAEAYRSDARVADPYSSGSFPTPYTEPYGGQPLAGDSYRQQPSPARSSTRSGARSTARSALAQTGQGLDTATESLLRRGLGAVGLIGVALIHVLDLPGKLEETPYLGVGYIGLIIGALMVAEALVRRESLRTWLAAGALAGATLLGYAVNRTVGMPGATDDIGNWLEPLGLASLFVEGVVVALAVVAVLRTADTRD
jgi:hypothetical protein